MEGSDTLLERSVLVLNASYEPLGLTSVRRGLLLVLAGRVEVLAESDQVWHSASHAFSVPSVVRVTRYVRTSRLRTVGSVSLSGLIARDGSKCAYCQSRDGSTIDHVVPRSRGGQHSWENTVAACERCNSKKAAHLLSEVNMTLHVTPRRPSSSLALALTRVAWDPTWADYLGSPSRDLADLEALAS